MCSVKDCDVEPVVLVDLVPNGVMITRPGPGDEADPATGEITGDNVHEVELGAQRVGFCLAHTADYPGLKGPLDHGHIVRKASAKTFFEFPDPSMFLAEHYGWQLD